MFEYEEFDLPNRLLYFARNYQNLELFNFNMVNDRLEIFEFFWNILYISSWIVFELELKFPEHTSSDIYGDENLYNDGQMLKIKYTSFPKFVSKP